MSDDKCFRTLGDRLRYLAQVAKTPVMKNALAAAAVEIEAQSKRLADWEARGIESDAKIGHLEQEIARMKKLPSVPPWWDSTIRGKVPDTPSGAS